MKIRYIIFSFVALFALFGCFEDKGNYVYNKLPVLVVALVPGTITNVVHGESAKLVVAMQYIPEGYVSEYTYEWLNDKLEVFHTGNEYLFEGTAVGSFKFGVNATDVKTGAVYTTSFTIQVDPIFKKGFVILAEDGENADMHFVIASKVKGNAETFSNDSIIYTKEYTSIYKTIVGEPIVGKPFRMSEHWGYEADDVLGELSVETMVANEHKIIEVNGTTMKRETYIEQEFLGGVMPTNFKSKKIIQTAWDSFIINEDGRVFNRRSASNKGFHLGHYDAVLPLWGHNAYVENIFMSHFVDCNLLLAIEKDAETGKRNFVAIYEGGSAADRSGLRMPQQFNDDPRYNDLKDEILFDDYFKTDVDNSSGRSKLGMNALITKNSSNELFLNILTHEYQRGDPYYLNFIEPEGAEDAKEGEDLNKINLSKDYGIKSLKGMFTIKTYYDKIVYMYDDHNVYCYDYLNKKFSTVHSFPDKVITAATSNSMLDIRKEMIKNFKLMRASLAFGFDDGSFQIYELEPFVFDKLDKLVYENKANYGKIKQILYKIGRDLAGFTDLYIN